MEYISVITLADIYMRGNAMRDDIFKTAEQNSHEANSNKQWHNAGYDKVRNYVLYHEIMITSLS